MHTEGAKFLRCNRDSSMQCKQVPTEQHTSFELSLHLSQQRPKSKKKTQNTTKSWNWLTRYEIFARRTEIQTPRPTFGNFDKTKIRGTPKTKNCMSFERYQEWPKQLFTRQSPFSSQFFWNNNYFSIFFKNLTDFQRFLAFKKFYNLSNNFDKF